MLLAHQLQHRSRQWRVSLVRKEGIGWLNKEIREKKVGVQNKIIVFANQISQFLIIEKKK
jgi:hypothetical protein